MVNQENLDLEVLQYHNMIKLGQLRKVDLLIHDCKYHEANLKNLLFFGTVCTKATKYCIDNLEEFVPGQELSKLSKDIQANLNFRVINDKDDNIDFMYNLIKRSLYTVEEIKGQKELWLK